MRPLKSIAKSLAKSKTAAKQKKELQAAIKAKSANKVRVRTKLTEGAKKAKNKDYGISRGSGQLIRKTGGPVAGKKSLKKYQFEGEVEETTPTQTPPAAPAATTKTFADTYKANVAAGLKPRKARIEAEREMGYVQPKQRVNPNTVIEAIGNTAASAINAAGARRMGMKKGGSVKKTIMKTGGIKKNSAVDPEGNTIKTRENTRTGKTVTKVKYADPKSSGMKRERTVTPGLSRTKRKANELYANNPQAAKEDDFTPFKRKGGVSKMQSGGMSEGRNIGQKAAERKTAKGKGFISSIMGANPSGNKGNYIPFTKAGKKDAKTKGSVSSKEMKPKRSIMQSGGAATKTRSITANAANRKVAKGKGTIDYVYGGKDAPGTGTNKGNYIGFSKESRKSSSPFVSMKDAKPGRAIKQKGGVAKPKAMYGMSVKPSMMKKGGAKKK